MRAERFHGLRIRSPSWRNELNENEIRQKPGLAGLFIFAGTAPGKLPSAKFLPLLRVSTGSPLQARAWSFCNSA
jgi:hypothetical protein